MVNLKLCLVACVLLTGAVYARDSLGPRGEAAQGIIVYSRPSSPHPMPLLVESPAGNAYRLWLQPDYDIAQQLAAFAIVLESLGAKTAEDASNLLDPTGKLHGYQPYTLAASDFTRGARNSTYGETRVFDLPSLGVKLKITLGNVRVERTPASSLVPAGYEFSELTLYVTVERLAPTLPVRK